MQIVIDIPEDVLKRTVFYREFKDLNDCITTIKALEKAITLPKGHGRLIDADELKKKYPHDTDWDYPVNTNSYVVESIDNLPTIIESDKEGENNDRNSN